MPWLKAPTPEKAAELLSNKKARLALFRKYPCGFSDAAAELLRQKVPHGKVVEIDVGDNTKYPKARHVFEKLLRRLPPDWHTVPQVFVLVGGKARYIGRGDEVRAAVERMDG